MNESRIRRCSWLGLLLAALLAGHSAAGSGSGLNTIVVINQNSANSRELGNYFCERRQVPPENVLRISWAGGNIAWSFDEFQTNLFLPLRAMQLSRGLTNQIDYVVLSMDIPFQTVSNGVYNSTTAVLFFGFKDPAGGDSKSTINSYAASEGDFRNAKPASAPGVSFLATMITANSLAQAKQTVDHGADSDGTFPTATVLLEKSSDTLRNVRYHAFDNAIFNTRIRGNYSVQRTASDVTSGLTNLLGLQTGLAGFSVSPGTFVPGAIADSMTSFGGIIFGPSGQTTLMEFLNAGAAGSYGTVTEPYPDPQKFPDPQVYFYQARGFSLAECYYQSLVEPFQGLVGGEPLAAPFAKPGSGRWLGISSNAVLSGIAPLSVQFSAPDPTRPIQQVDLFIDGKFLRTLTNLPPTPGNVLNLTLNGVALNYTVPPGATIALVTSNLTALINGPAVTNATGTLAIWHGDRIELHYTATNGPAAPIGLRIIVGEEDAPPVAPAAVSAGSSAGSASGLTTYLMASRSSFLPAPVCGIKACSVFGSVAAGAWIQARVSKVSGQQVIVSVTNPPTGTTLSNLTWQLVNRINTSPALQDLDGIVAEDFAGSWMGSASFNLRSRDQGSRSAATVVTMVGSTTLAVIPDVPMALRENLSDLHPRNHLYVMAGKTNLTVNFPLDTTALADGVHELTAVGYEGSHVRTQTRVTFPIGVQNSTLNATLDFLDPTNSASAQGIYRIQVAANTGAVNNISLFSTGGQLNSVAGQSSVVFNVDASVLGPGLHPFYAIVDAASGAKYRTAVRFVRFGN